MHTNTRGCESAPRNISILCYLLFFGVGKLTKMRKCENENCYGLVNLSLSQTHLINSHLLAAATELAHNYFEWNTATLQTKKLFSFVRNSQFCIGILSSIPFRIVTFYFYIGRSFFMRVFFNIKQPFLCIIFIRLMFVKIFSCAQLLKLLRIFTWFTLHWNDWLTDIASDHNCTIYIRPIDLIVFISMTTTTTSTTTPIKRLK